MIVCLTKGRNRPDMLACLRDDGTTTWTRLKPFLAPHDLPPPAWLPADKIPAVRERLWHLLGQWNALPPGEKLELPFEG